MHIDVSGNIAIAKVEMVLPNARLSGGTFNLSKPVPEVARVSYLSLLKFKEGWLIVSVVNSISESDAAPSSKD